MQNIQTLKFFFFLIAVILITSCSGSSSEPSRKSSSYLPLIVGNNWYYEGTQNSNTAIVTGTRSINGNLTYALENFLSDPPILYLASDETGIKLHGAMVNGVLDTKDPPEYLFKIPSQVDETWFSFNSTTEFKTISNTETITVPAGTFSNVYRIKQTSDWGTLEYFVAQGVGIVRMVQTENGLVETRNLVSYIIDGSGSKSPPDTPNPTSTLSDQLSNISDSIQSVNDLAIPQSLVSNVTGDPCAGLAFPDCIPLVLKSSVSFILGEPTTFVVQLTTDLANAFNGKDVKAGDSGNFSVTVNKQDFIIDYNIVSDTEYAIQIKEATNSIIQYISIKDNVTDFYMSVSDPSAPQFHITVDYTDNTHFDTRVELVFDSCNDMDIRGPQKLVVVANRSGDILKGKSMSYHPRWNYSDANPMTCADQPTADSKTFFYNDFVDDDTNTTAASSLVPPGVNNANEIVNYPPSEFCNTFTTICPIPTDFSAYQNNYCVTATDYTWNMTCQSTNMDISTPNYSDMSLWILPVDFEALTITIPTL